MAAPPPGSVDGKSLVLDATDLVALVGETVQLKKSGRRYVGLCPFHSEKSPSFGVDPAKQFYFCFGCKKGGNAIDFVIERDRLDFKAALHLLADRAGVTLPKFGRDDGGKADRLSVLRDAVSRAADVYRQALKSDEGKAAREYLKSRGFNDRTVDAFGLGYAPDGWDGLARAGLAKKFDDDVLLEAGLIKRGDRGGLYDTFRRRLIFPIRDEQGRPVAFGGRVLPGDDSPAKYLNSPETPLFSKSKVLFGLDLAKAAVVKGKTAVVFEGYADAAMARQHGVENAVAVLGTSLTPEHAATLRRLCERVVLVFDADAAGATATRRSVELFLREQIDVAIADLPPGTDPDEFLQANGLAAFTSLVDNAVDALGFQWRLLTRAAGGESVTGRQRAVDEYLRVLREARGDGRGIDDLRWSAVLSRVSRLTGLPVADIQARLGGSQRPPAPPPRRDRWRRRDDPLGDGPRRADVPRGDVEDAAARLEGQLLGAMFDRPALWDDVQARVGVDDFEDARMRWLADRWWDRLREEGEPTFAEWLGEVVEHALSASGGDAGRADRARQLCIALQQRASDRGDAAELARDAVAALLRRRERRRIGELQASLRRNAGQGGLPGSGEHAPNDAEAEALRHLQERVAKDRRGS